MLIKSASLVHSAHCCVDIIIRRQRLPSAHAAARGFSSQRQTRVRPASQVVDVDPLGGRLVIYDARAVLHEVVPTVQMRDALTLWILDSDAVGEAADGIRWITSGAPKAAATPV